MSRDPQAVAADKAAIDAAVMQLCRAAKVKVTLPPANPDAAKGPFSHLRAALKVLPTERMQKRFPTWNDSWFDRLARNDSPLGIGEAGARKWKGLTRAEKTVIASGTGVIGRPDGTVLWLSPAGPGAAVFALEKAALVQLGTSVRDFAEREVAQLLGTKLEALATTAPEGAQAHLATARGLDKLRRTQPRASVVQAELVRAEVVEGFADGQALLDATAKATADGLTCFYGFADAENADDATLKDHPWLFGHSVAKTRGRLALQRVQADYLVARGGRARASLFAGPRCIVTTIDFVKVTPKQLAAATHLVAEVGD
ncbi:MAG: hypothetical protein JNM17_19325 [Archangium sp.]|nr:hypothetical protein [Archangium sp.]